MEVLYANEDVGISLYDQHRFAEAARAFDAVLSQIQTLASLYPANKTYRKEVGTTLAWVADAQKAQGNLDRAIAVRSQQVATLTQLLAMGADSSVQARLVVAHQGLGVALMDRGQTERGVQELNTAAVQADQLVGIEPKNADWKSIAARAHFDLALALLSLGRRNDAAQQAAIGCSQAASLPSTFAITARTRLRTGCAMIQARLALAAGATEQALRFAEQALASARSEHSEDPITDRYRIARMSRLVGDVRKSGGDAAGAAAIWNSALAALPANVSERPGETNERLQLLKRLGRTDEARALSDRLSRMGYRILD
jgi:tetratricopeptide (TPR) repeat protein